MVEFPPNFVPTVESVACDHCGNSGSRHLFSGPDLLHGFPGTFCMVECDHCGWIRQDPRPIATDLDRYYPNNYEPYRKAIDDEKPFWNRWDRRYGMIKQCQAIEKHVPRGNILEIGCGTGNFLYEMKRRGWSVLGVEPHKYASNYARTRFDMDIFTGTLEEFDPGARESFDVVASWNVLEHLPNPAQGIVKMSRLVKKGGLLVMGFPSLESLDRKLFGRYWIGWDLPRHLYLIPRVSLEKMLDRLGIQIIGTGCTSGSYHATLMSLQFLLRERVGWKTADAVTEIARQLPFRVLTIPIFWTVDRLGLSSLLTYYCRRLG